MEVAILLTAIAALLTSFITMLTVREMKNLLELKGYKVGINNPYSNAIVPSQFYGNELVKSIMIEVNKRLYLTDKFEKSDNFLKTKTTITELLEIISTEEENYNLI